MARKPANPDFYPCGDPRTAENTVVKNGGKQKNRKYCKACENARSKRWQAENPEKVELYRMVSADRRYAAGKRDSDWYHANKERAAAAQKAWKENNRERLYAIQKAYRERVKAKKALEKASEA